MYISARKTWEILTLFHLGFTLLTALFGAVYELFSHGVYSYHMIYAFAIPLVLGLVPFLIRLVRKESRVNQTSLRLWNAGIITLTVGSLFQGVLDIYGTTNDLILVYLIAGALFLLAGSILRFSSRLTGELSDSEENS